MPDVVLVQPQVGDWDEVRSHPSLPLGLLSASRLVANEFETALIDTRLDKDWKASLRLEVGKKPLCVGVTSMTGRQIASALEISEFIKGISDIPVVWGGIHPSLLPETTLENKNIDIVVSGEGETAFIELVRALAKKGSLAGIAGICYKENGKVIINQPRAFVNLDELPGLPLGIIDINKYLPIFKGRRTFYIETSRGCPNRCGFCYNAAYNKNKWRAHSAQSVIKELKRLTAVYGIGSFYIIDDNFFVDLKRAKDICEGIIKERLDIYWEAQGISINSALKMDGGYLKLLVDAGLKKVHFGVESASPKVLNTVGKGLEIDDVIEINSRWKKYPIIIQYNFMCGFPGEEIEDIRMTKDLILRLMRDNPNALISPLCPYTPYPGTALYEKALAKGFIRKKTLEDWRLTDYGDDLWDSKERKELLSSLFFVSMFLDSHRSKDMVDSLFLKILIDLYRPIAKFRMSHLFFKFMPELAVKNLLSRRPKCAA